MIILKLSPTENTAKEIAWLWEKDEILRQKWENRTVAEEEENLKNSQGSKIIFVAWKKAWRDRPQR